MTSYYRKKHMLPIRDRVLLHLSEFVGMRGLVDVPFAITQSGIAERLGIRRSQVSQEISPLVKEGYLTDSLCHVRGHKRRRRAYFITPRGINAAREIEMNVGEELVVFKTKDGRERTMRLDEIPEHLEEGAKILDVAMSTSRGRFDMDSYAKATGRGREYIEIADDMPSVTTFVGRKKELEDIREWYKSERQKVLTISGMAGIGKSSLAARAFDIYKGMTNIFFYRIKNWSTIQGVLLRFSGFLSEMGKSELRFYLEANKSPDLEVISLLLEDCLRGLDLLLIFDDCERAPSRVVDFISLMVSLKVQKLRVILVGKSIPPVYDQREVRIEERVREIALDGLNREESFELLRSRGVEESYFEKLYKQTQGHPLFLLLVDPKAELLPQDVREFLAKEVISNITDDEREILELVSIYRQPIYSSGLLIDGDVNYPAIDSLLEKKLLYEDANHRYSSHELVKNFFATRTQMKKKKKYHKVASEYFLSLMDEESAVEAIYHLVEAGERQEALQVALDRGRDIIRKGHSERFSSIVNELTTLEMDPESRVELALLRGDMLELEGEWDRALEEYGELVTMAGEVHLPKVEAEARRKIAAIKQHRGLFEEAIEEYERAKSLFEREGDRTGISEVSCDMISCNLVMGEVTTAQELLESVKEFLQESTDERLVGRILYTEGLVVSHVDQHQDSISAKKKSVGIFENLQDMHELGKAYNGLGVSFYEMQRNKEAISYFEKAIAIAERAGDLRNLGYALANAASVYLEEPDLLKAERYLRKARNIFVRLDEKKMLGHTYLSFGFLYQKHGKFNDADACLRKSLAMYEDLGNSQFLAATLKQAGQLYRQMHMTVEARRCLQRALSEFLEIEEETAIEEVTSLMKKIDGDQTL